MAATEIISFDELSDKTESMTNDKFKACGEALLAALNDWPTTDLKEPTDLLDELTNEIGKPLTFYVLNDYSEKLNPFISGNSWKMESIASLLEMFNLEPTLDKEVTLDKIIVRLSNYYRTTT